MAKGCWEYNGALNGGRKYPSDHLPRNFRRNNFGINLRQLRADLLELFSTLLGYTF